MLAASYRIMALRLTAQATPRNKFSVFWDQQQPCEGGAASGYSGNACRKSGDRAKSSAGSTAAPTPSASATLAPETAAYRDYRQSRLAGEVDVTGQQPVAARSGLRHVPQPLGRRADARPRHRDLIRVVEQCAGGCAGNGNIRG